MIKNKLYFSINFDVNCEINNIYGLKYLSTIKNEAFYKINKFIIMLYSYNKIIKQYSGQIDNYNKTLYNLCEIHINTAIYTDDFMNFYKLLL